MAISDKEAFRVLGLPLGVDRDAIQERYKQLSCKLSASNAPEDRRKLDLVVAAFSQLIPQQQQSSNIKCKNKSGTGNLCQNNSIYSSEEDIFKGRNTNNLRNGVIKVETDVDKDRRKAERRKAKKKKQKEKKKQGKLDNLNVNHNSNNNNNSNKKSEDGDSESEEEIVEEVQGIDPNSAFVAMVGKKIGSNSVQSNLSSNNSSSSIRNQDSSKRMKNPEKLQVIEARQNQSRQHAIKGNEEANKGEYKRAIHLFTEAIRLDPNDHRFFGNRSYCYGQLHLYNEALKDAEKAIKLAPEWPKGHFRRGIALKGLGKLLESEEAFKQVLRYDSGCEDAVQEINKVRKRRLVDMGFTENQAKAAIKKYSQVQPALDALLAGEFQNSENIFFSDDEDEVEVIYQPAPKPKDVKMNPKNLEGLTSLWVGNVVPEVTEKALIKLFGKYGNVTSVRQLKDKYCAFVNYSDKKSAGNAMEGLQSYELCGSKLLIKFPDNPIVNGSQNIIIRKNKNAKTTAMTSLTSTNYSTVIQTNLSEATPSNTATSSAPKVRGPVNGDECYFWRTTGCGFADTCKYNHIPKHKGIDKKPWQK